MVGWFDWMADILWPARCLGCRITRTWWCEECDGRVVEVRQRTCPKCNRLEPTGRYCPACRKSTALTGIFAGAYFREPLVAAVHGLKYRSAKVLTPHLAKYLVGAVAPGRFQRALVVPIPLHPRKLARRGHNQADLLAAAFSKETGLATNHDLCRVRDTRSQTGLGRVGRAANVEGAFAWRGQSLAGRQVLLVDDVLTTGATLNSAAAALRAAGAREVWGLVVAKR